MTHTVKNYYQNKAVAGRYYNKRFLSITGRFNHYLEKSFLINVIQKLEIESALDVACGTGRLTKELLSLDIPAICGVDIAQEMLDVAKQYCGAENSNLIFNREDAEELSFQDNSFDMVISFRFLDHLPMNQKKKVLSEMIRCSRKLVVFTMANKNGWTVFAQKIRNLLDKNFYEGYLVNESDICAFLKTENVRIVARKLKLPLLSMEIMYCCEVL
jgi:ubiquinone/menaquinone biosynthesis C-methylase UbiE